MERNVVLLACPSHFTPEYDLVANVLSTMNEKPARLTHFESTETMLSDANIFNQFQIQEVSDVMLCVLTNEAGKVYEDVNKPLVDDIEYALRCDKPIYVYYSDIIKEANFAEDKRWYDIIITIKLLRKKHDPNNRLSIKEYRDNQSLEELLIADLQTSLFEKEMLEPIN